MGTGSSAGSLGTQVWAATLLREFRYRNAAVLADSYAGIFPIGTQGPLLKSFGMCDLGLLSAVLKRSCDMETLDVQTIFEAAMHDNPQVAFASIDSKSDAIQIAFYE